MGFTLLYFKMVVMPLVPETKMVDVGKLISLGNLLVRNVTWLLLTLTCATLILSRAFGVNCMTWIAYIYSRIPHCDFQRQHTLSLSLFLSLSLSLSLSIYLSILHFDFQQWTPRICIHSTTLFFLVLPFLLDFFQPRTKPQKFRQSPKETNNQHWRRLVPPRTRCYISIHRYLTWNT